MGQMYYGVNCFEVIGKLVIVIELKKEIMVVGFTSNSYQIASRTKWCKMDLKWEKHQCLGLPVEKCHIIAVFDLTLSLLIKKSTSLLTRPKFSLFNKSPSVRNFLL